MQYLCEDVHKTVDVAYMKNALSHKCSIPHLVRNAFESCSDDRLGPVTFIVFNKIAAIWEADSLLYWTAIRMFRIV